MTKGHSNSKIQQGVQCSEGEDQLEQISEERRESCSVVSKVVRIIIYRVKPVDGLGEGEIVGFQCNNSSVQCINRCYYKYFVDDF